MQQLLTGSHAHHLYFHLLPSMKVCSPLFQSDVYMADTTNQVMVRGMLQYFSL